MNWVGYQQFDVSKLALPGDIGARMKDPRVAELAASTDELGGEPMHAPTVNADVTPPELVAGRDRMAATLLRKRKKVWCHVGVNWTPEELLKAEIHENLHRRHDDKAALTRALVSKAEALIVGHASDNSDEPRTGRPKAARTKAREIVAAASGDSVEAVRKLDERAKEREEGAAGNRVSAQAAPPPPPIDLHGHAMPPHVSIGLNVVIGAFDKADRLLRQAQAAIGELGLTDFSPGVVARIKAAIHDVAAQVRHDRPAHLCPKCKGQSHPITGPRCGLCQERGIVTDAQYEAAPAEQRAPGGPGSANVKATLAKAPSRGVLVPVVPEGTIEFDPPAKPRKGLRISVNGGPAMDIADAEAWAKGAEASIPTEPGEGGGRDE